MLLAPLAHRGWYGAGVCVCALGQGVCVHMWFGAGVCVRACFGAGVCVCEYTRTCSLLWASDVLLGHPLPTHRGPPRASLSAAAVSHCLDPSQRHLFWILLQSRTRLVSSFVSCSLTHWHSKAGGWWLLAWNDWLQSRLLGNKAEDTRGLRLPQHLRQTGFYMLRVLAAWRSMSSFFLIYLVAVGLSCSICDPVACGI